MTSTPPEGHERGVGENSPAPRTRIPLGSASVGSLQIRRVLAGTTITGDRKLDDLLHGWWRREPGATAEDGVVTLTYPRRHRQLARRRTDEICLNASIPWDISIKAGAHRVGADLSQLELRSLTIDGGAQRFALVLGPPEGEVRIDLNAADRVTIRRPVTTAVRLRVAKGASQVVVDDQVLGAGGGETVLTTGPVLYNFYNINVTAARRLRVTTI